MKSLYERQIEAIDESIAYNRQKKQDLFKQIEKVDQIIVEWENRKTQIKRKLEMNPMLQRIREMHTKFGITPDQVAFSPQEKEFRIAAMQEELDEYKDVEAGQNPAEEFDALIDLVVFAFGTAERQGWLEKFEEGFNRVMDANMKKELGANQKRGSFALDLVKPEGWTAPNHDDLVGGA